VITGEHFPHELVYRIGGLGKVRHAATIESAVLFECVFKPQMLDRKGR
jgi:hypothetical protein